MFFYKVESEKTGRFAGTVLWLRLFRWATRARNLEMDMTSKPSIISFTK